MITWISFSGANFIYYLYYGGVQCNEVFICKGVSVDVIVIQLCQVIWLMIMAILIIIIIIVLVVACNGYCRDCGNGMNCV